MPQATGLHRYRPLSLLVTALIAGVLWLGPHAGGSSAPSNPARRVSAPQGTTKLRSPLSNFNPYNVTINSIIDHDRGQHDIAVGYTGERGRAIDGNVHTSSGLRGFVSHSGKKFILNGHYSGAGDAYALWYEEGTNFIYQHPGYDYSVNDASYIQAPADGTLWIVKTDPVNGQGLGSGRKSSAWLKFHTFKIVHDSDGLVTWYLHSDRFISPTKDGPGTRDLDGEVRNAMGGDAFFDGSKALTDARSEEHTSELQ